MSRGKRNSTSSYPAQPGSKARTSEFSIGSRSKRATVPLDWSKVSDLGPCSWTCVVAVSHFLLCLTQFRAFCRSGPLLFRQGRDLERPVRRRHCVSGRRNPCGWIPQLLVGRGSALAYGHGQPGRRLDGRADMGVRNHRRKTLSYETQYRHKGWGMQARPSGV